MRIAMLFNSFAGKQAAFHRYAELAANAFQGHTMLTCSGGLGESYLAGLIPGLQIVPCEASTFIEQINEATAHMAQRHPDLLICVGGDGFIAYTADWLIRQQRDIPLLGIAGGTANVGPLIRFTEDRLERLNPDKLLYERVGAVEVEADGRVLGYAFNDLIIGDTFLSSVEGRMVNIAAADFLKDGSKRVVRPSPGIAGDHFQLHRNGNRVDFTLKKPAQIVVSPLHKKEFYRGKAITGALTCAGYSEHGAAVGLSNRVLVDARMDGTDDRTIVIEHILFKAGDTIAMSGFTDKGYLIIDGNPFLCTEGKVTLRYLDGIVTCAYTG